MYVTVGAHQRSKKAKGQLEIPVKEKHKHEKFSFDTSILNFDIALLHLKTSVNFTDTVSPICLPSHDLILPHGARALAAGWGLPKGDLLFKFFYFWPISLSSIIKIQGYEEFIFYNNRFFIVQLTWKLLFHFKRVVQRWILYNRWTWKWCIQVTVTTLSIITKVTWTSRTWFVPDFEAARLILVRWIKRTLFQSCYLSGYF